MTKFTIYKVTNYDNMSIYFFMLGFESVERGKDCDLSLNQEEITDTWGCKLAVSFAHRKYDEIDNDSQFRYKILQEENKSYPIGCLLKKNQVGKYDIVFNSYEETRTNGTNFSENFQFHDGDDEISESSLVPESNFVTIKTASSPKPKNFSEIQRICKIMNSKLQRFFINLLQISDKWN